MNEGETNDDDTMEDDVEVDRESQQYRDKVEEIRCYLPTIQSLMIRCNDEEEDSVISRKTCVKKLSQLMKTFVSPKKKLAYSSMLKIERLLKSLTTKMKLQSRKANGSPVNKSSSPQPSTSQDSTSSSSPMPSTSKNAVSVFGGSPSQKSEKVKLSDTKLESNKDNSSKSSSTSPSKRKKLASDEKTSTITETKLKKKKSSFKSSFANKFDDIPRKTNPVSNIEKTKRYKFDCNSTGRIVDTSEFSSGPQEFSNRFLTPRSVPRQFTPAYQRGPTYTSRFPQTRFPQSRYPGPRYSEPRYSNLGYSEPRYAKPRYPEPRYSDPSYPEPRYPEVRFRDQRCTQTRFPEPRSTQDRYNQPIFPESIEREFTNTSRTIYPLQKDGDLRALGNQVDLRHELEARRRSSEQREEQAFFSDSHVRIVRRQAPLSPDNEAEKSSSGDIKIERQTKSLQKKRKFDEKEDQEEAVDTEWPKNITFSRRRVGASSSPDINLDALGNQDDNNQKDEDAINLEKSKRKLEVLMQNRLASMNAGRISCTKSKVTDNNRNLVTQAAENSVETVSPFSSTLDEMMSNLNAKFRTNRCQLKNNKELEKDQTSNTIKSVYNCEKTNFCKKETLINKNESSHSLLENSQQSRSPPPVCSFLTGQNKVVPFLRDENDDFGVTKFPWDNSNATKPKIDPEVPPGYEMCDKGEPAVSGNASQWHNSPKPNHELPDVSFLNKTKEKDEITKDLEINQVDESGLSIPLHQKIPSDSTKSDFNTVKSFQEKCNVNILSTLDKCDLTKRSDDKLQDSILNSPGKTYRELDNSNQLVNLKGLDDASNKESFRLNQSLRSKLSEEITTLHKVGSSYGGALRGLINRDKMMPPGRLASLKPGTLIDLIQEEKPQRPVSRAKNRPIIPQSNNDVSIQSSSSDITKTLSKDCNDIKTTPVKSRDANEILSQLSEQDLKKLIHENIGDLPNPPNVSFLVRKESDTQVSPNPKSSWGTNEITMQQFHVQPQHVLINNTTLSPTANSTLTQNQNCQPNSWSPTHVNDSWKNISSKDPRRETMNVSVSHGSIQNPEVGISSDQISHSFVNSNDSFTKNTENVYSGQCQIRSYNPPTLQTDPFRSPCYDGSSTPDPYRPDPYTLSLKENTEKDISLLNLKTTQRPQLMEAPLRTPLLETPQRASLLESSQRHPHLEIPLHYSQDGTQRTSLSSQHIISNDNVYTPMYAVNQQFKPGDPRFRSMTNTYAAWRSEENFDRKLNHSQVQESSSSYYDRACEDRRNYSNNYSWSREYSHSSPYSHRSRNYERHYKGSLNYNCPRSAHKQSDVPRKLSARDPRRKSAEESFDKIDTNKSIVDHEVFKQDHRSHEKNPLKDKRGKESHCDDKFSNKGRPVNNPLYEKSQYKKDDSARHSTDDPSLKDTYTSPLDKLYTNMEIPKTGLGYGVQKFRIPKIKRYGNDQSSKLGSKEKSQSSIPMIPAVTEENTNPIIVTENKITHDKDNASLEVKSDYEHVEEKDKQCENNKSDVEEGSDIKRLAKSKLNPGESSKTKIQVTPLKSEIRCDELKDKDSPTRRSKRIQQNQAQKAVDTLSKEDSLLNSLSDEEKCDLSNILCTEHDTCAEGNTKSKKSTETDKQNLEAEFPPDKKDEGGIANENQVMTSTEQDINETLESILLSDENKEIAEDQPDHTNSNMSQHSAVTSSFEADCAIDLSLKKNTTDENLCNNKSGGIKNINNPPTVVGLPSQSFDSGMELNKTASRIAQVPSLKQDKVSIVDSERKLRMIQDVFGHKLTHDKIMKVAELLKVIDSEDTENDNINDSKSEKNGDSELTPINKSLTMIEDIKQENDIEKITNSQNDSNKSNISITEEDECKKEEEIKKEIPPKSKSYKKKRKTKQKTQVLEKPQSKPPVQKTKRKYKNELDRLQDDISKYHDSEAIAAASGMRMCRLQKEKTALTQNSVQTVNDSKKKVVGKKTDTYIKVEKDEEPADVDSTDSEESWNLLSEKLMMKYGHLMSEDERVQDPAKDKKPELVCLSTQKKIISDQTQENCKQIGKTSSQSKIEEDLSSESVQSREPNQDKTVTDEISAAQLITHNNDENKPVNKSDDSKLPVECIDGKSGSSSPCAKERGVKLSNKEKFRSVKFSGRRANHSDNNSVPNKTLSDNIVQKYKIRKQKKKCLWYAGIIKKKTKRKKSVELELMQSVDTEDIGEQEIKMEDLEEDHNLETSNSEDLMIVEPPDKNYYQEGESKSTKCKLCPFSGKAIVTHYAITHPKDEVLISRMSPVAAEIAKLESSIFFGQSEEERIEVDKFRCRVCYQEFSKFFMFFEHMALHTGEFRHECCKCGYRTSTRSGITKHCLTHAQSSKNIMKTSCRVLYKEPSDRSHFLGHLCSICNFFQIHYINVKRHVENIHNSQDFTNIIKINFSKLPYVESVMALNVQTLKEKRSRKEISEEIAFVESSSLSEKPEFNMVEDISDEVTEQQKSRMPQIQASNENMNTSDEQINQSKTIDENYGEGNISDTELNILTSVSVADEVRDNEMESAQPSTSDKPETEGEETVKETEKGCFQLSPELDNYSQIIDEDVSNSYKEKCKEIISSISIKNLPRHEHGFIEKMAIKQNTEENDSEKIYTLHSLVSSKRKKDDGGADKLIIPEKSEMMDDCSEITPARRQLPDRICKGLIKTKPNEIDYEEDNFVDFFQTDDDHSNDDFVEEFTEGRLCSDGVVNASTSTLFLFERQIERCKELTANNKTYQPAVTNYNSSLPTNSNLSEFTHVMKQISQFTLKPTDCKEVTVGGLKVNQTSNSIEFSCSVKVFNKSCQFQTESLEIFGQHVNMLHHTTFWDGTCGACFIVFIQDTSSHDKAPIHTQSRAFCHLVREHLTFVKKLSRTDSKGSLSSKGVSEVQARPKLRVRRLSGDKLSSSGPENVLPQPQMEVTGSTSNDESDFKARPSLVSHSDSQSSPAIDNNKKVPIPVRQKVCIGSLRTEGRRCNFMSSLIAKKSGIAYQNMCSHKKLRHLYKCMGANCSFSTMSSKEFTSHFDQHRDMFLISIVVGEDPQRGFWRNCSYCPTSYSTSKELLVHIRKEHAQCLLQCGYCFYRAKSIANVHFHHINDHQKEIFCALQCEQRELNLPPFREKPFTEFVTPLRCTRDGCNLFTYMLDTFCNHQISVHGNNLICHFCGVDLTTISSLLKHSSEAHGIGLYQCLYCVFGTSTEHEIRIHLCYKHPSCIPKAIHRTDSNAKSSAGTKRESLKRIVFYKDQDKLLKHLIPLPSEETEEGGSAETQKVSNPPGSETPPPKLESVISSPTGSPYRPVIFRGINSNPATTTLTQPQKIIIMSSGSSIPPTPVKLIRLAPSSNALPVSSPIKNLITISPVMQVPTSSNKSGASALSPCRIIVPISTPVATITPTTSGVQRKSVITSLVGSPVTTSLVTMPTTSLAIRRPIMTSSITEKTLDTASFSVSDTTSILPETSFPIKLEEPLTKDVEEKYFKCGNKGCNFESSTSVPLRNHLIICDHARQSQRLVCAFCNRLFKQGPSLIDHLRIHGPNRFSCALCDLKEPIQSKINVHMKAIHNITNTILVPVDTLKQDTDKDLFVVTPKERQSRGFGKSGGARPKKTEGMKTKFCLEEVDDIPNTAIFQTPLGCFLCPYETKVRSNLIRHISQHTSGNNVSQEEVVNPVPEKTEKMFDKMMNLAGSSHKKKTSQEDEVSGQVDIDCQYKYVPEQLRYLCHLKECGYQTISESMLRFHISVIHKDDTVYLCPHCPESSNPIPIDQLGLHLKLHDSPLYKCSYCEYFSHIKRSIEKHQSDAHPDKVASVLVVRTAKPNQPEGPVPKPVLPADQSDEHVAGEEWLSCTICSFKTKKKKAMLSHGVSEHQMAKPFQCPLCNYESAADHLFKSHFKTYHPEEEACEVIALYKKVTEVKKPNLAPIPPLWKRDSKRIKLIRGIKLDEKGDAPPPVATCINKDVSDLDILELKFGSFGRPSYDGLFECPRCPTFQVKSKQEMREHLYKDLEYKPFSCITCKFATTQKTKVLKHINKVHNIDSERCASFVETNTNQDMEDWVEKVMTTQIEIALNRDPTAEEFKPRIETVVKKRRRSSVDVGSEVQTVTCMPSTPVDERPSTSGVSANRSSVERGDIPCSDIGYSSSGEKDVSKNTPEKKKKRDKSPSKHRFGCNYCSVTTKYKNSIVQHMKRTHANLPVKIVSLDNWFYDGESVAYSCMHCNCTALNLSDLKQHYIKSHKESGLSFKFKKTNVHCELDYECYWCKKRFNVRLMELHCRTVHSDLCLLTPATVPKYKCSQCDLILNSVEILKRHFLMDHPSQEFSYVIVHTQKSDLSGESSTPASSTTENSSQIRQNEMFKCFSCHFVCSQYWPMVKHLDRHFVTYVCTECDNVYSTAFAVRNHILNDHKGSDIKPVVLKGSEKDIENAKSKIIIVSHSGKKRKITPEELAKAETEDKNCGQTLEMYSYDEPLKVAVHSPIRETARKSTSSRRQVTSTSVGDPVFPRCPPQRSRSPNYLAGDTTVTIPTQGKTIKLPSHVLQQLVNFDAELVVDDVSNQRT